MGTQIWISLEYLIPRVLAWVTLFALALWDTLRHRNLKVRGWQLNRAILVSWWHHFGCNNTCCLCRHLPLRRPCIYWQQCMLADRLSGEICVEHQGCSADLPDLNLLRKCCCSW